MESQLDLTAIIIINWNCFQDTCECIESLRGMSSTHFHIFLVDNGSTDDSLHRLSEQYLSQPDITIIPTGKNLGFAGGNNVGIIEAYARGFRYYWLLNADTIVEKDALTHLYNGIRADEGVGIVGSKIYYYNTDLVWFAGGKINTLTGKVYHVGMKQVDDNQYNKQTETDYITGCSLFFRRELLDTVGYMEDDYFLYYEETDWNIRVKQKGWRIKYIPESQVFHKVSASSGGEANIAPYVAYYEIRNRYIMIKRTQARIFRATAFAYLLWKSLLKVVKIYLKNQDRKKLRLHYIARGISDALRVRMGKHPDFVR